MLHRDLSKMTRRELTTYMASIDAELRALNEKRRAKGAELSKAQTIIAEMDRRAVEPTVSDHALIRFLERAKGFDVESVRAKMMTPTVIDAINSGATAIAIDGLKFRVREKVVTTVVD